MLCRRGWWLLIPAMEKRSYPAYLREPRVSESICDVEDKP
jgi:hypothetical protein